VKKKKNTGLEDLYLDKDTIIATFSELNPEKSLACKSTNTDDIKNADTSNLQDDKKENRSEIDKTLEEKIIQENLLVDPTHLDKQFTYKDCEVKDSLDPEIKAKLWKVRETHEAVFAKSKLDVGKFKEFTVQFDIEGQIPHEKQRFMSEEKQAFCDKTFQKFEKLGLIQECCTPKTVSNLLLVPKYEGLRDLTKASTYLAQVKGVKNTMFRIVQDLRRINAATKNLKKSSP